MSVLRVRMARRNAYGTATILIDDDKLKKRKKNDK